MLRKHNMTIILIFFVLLNVNLTPMIQSTSTYNQSESNLKEFCELEPRSNIEKNNYHLRLLPIHISGNKGLIGDTGRENGVVRGQGTIEDPYVISGFRIDCIKWLWEIFNPDDTHNNAAIWLRNIDRHVVIEQNNICNSYSKRDDHWYDGIFIEDCMNVTVHNNIVMDAADGILLSYSNVIVTNNEVSSCFIGICSGRDHSLISNNKIWYCGDGIRCVNSYAEVFDNEILTNLDGIETRSDWSYIHDNYIYGSQDMGIACLTSENIFEGNEIKYSEGCGIFIGGGPVPYVNRNTIMNNYGDGIYLSDGNVKIENNTISFNGGYGINCGDGVPYICHNTIHENSIGILSTYLSTIILYNEITSNSEYGIFSGHDTIIQYNNIEDNSYGLYRSGMMPWVTATYNWWGSTDGPGGDGPGSGDPVKYQAIYKPWLTRPCDTAGPV